MDWQSSKLEFVTLNALGGLVKALVGTGGPVLTGDDYPTLGEALRACSKENASCPSFRICAHGLRQFISHGIMLPGQGIRFRGKTHSYSSAEADWSPLATRIWSSVVIVGCGIGGGAATKAEMNTDTDGAAYCWKIAKIVNCPVYAAEADQYFENKGGGSYGLRAWAGTVWQFNPNGSRRNVQGAKDARPYPPPF